MIKRVAQEMRNRGAPGVELLARRGIAGANALRHAIRTHGAPFVVISPQPDFRKISEAVILGDESGRQVAVVVEDRLPFRVTVVEIARDGAMEQKVVVNEILHGQREMSLRIASRDA